MTVTSVLQPLISRNIFPDEETAIRKLTLDYVLRQIEVLKQSIVEYEQKYGMAFSQYEQYLHERTRLLESPTLSDTQRQRLGQSVMLEEDDWLDWKASQEMLESWLGLQQEAKS